MNARILDLIKNPGIIQNQDLALLNSEIKKHPYLQNIRALHLYGTHRFDPENYQKELSVTAAYTTDKKILYQLINKKTEIIKTKESPLISNGETVPIEEEESTPNNFNEVEFVPKPTAKPVFVEGVVNRILFEGEEDFLERETENIDLESTLESGMIVTRNSIKNEMKASQHLITPEESNFTEAKDAETFTRETVIKEDNISREEPVIEDLSEKSFHEVPDFLPEVKIDLPQKVDLQETQDAETFTPEKIIKKSEILKEEPVIEDPSKKSFHEVAEFLPEVKTEGSAAKIFTESQDAESFSKETVINELQIKEEEPKIDSSKISFHGLEEFLPDVKITTNITQSTKYEAPKPQPSKQETEMQRLIAEVEAKVKASKKEKVQEVESVENHDVNFSQTQNFAVDPSKEEVPSAKKPSDEISKVKELSEKILKPEAQIENKSQLKEETVEQASIPQKSSWKPMQFPGDTPDSLIDKKPETKTDGESASNSVNETVEQISAKKQSEKILEERPVFNASFFTQNVSAIASKKGEKPAGEIQKGEKLEAIIPDSNVPNFINTWQNWLKIERVEPVIEETPVSKVEVKNTVIAKFIEKEPRISKLKEESDFVVKERGSNISHLMTETLANLYVEQKLYAKAIKAYETLITKHPKKTSVFKDKIQEIKELRKNN